MSNFGIYKADLANSGFITIFQYQESVFSRIADLCHSLKIPEQCHKVSNVREKIDKPSKPTSVKAGLVT